MINRIAHVCLSAIDLGVTERFYCEILGMQKQFDFIFEEKVVGFYINAGGGNYIEIFHQDAIDDNDKHPIRHYCLETDNIDTVAEKLTSAGVEVTDKKLGADKSWQLWAADPSGIKIEFHQYTAESSQMTGADCILK